MLCLSLCSCSSSESASIDFESLSCSNVDFAVGAVSVLVSYLDRDCAEASAACSTLCVLCQPEHDTCGSNLNMLASMQGARKLSQLLQPSFRPNEKDMLKTGARNTFAPSCHAYLCVQCRSAWLHVQLR